MNLPSQIARSLRLFFILVICTTGILNVVRAETITIGTISLDPIEEARAFKPFSEYLAVQLASLGVQSVDIKIANSIRQAAKMLKEKELDFFIDSSVTAAHINDLSGSKFLLRRWKKAKGKYRSVIFVNADSPIKNLSGLLGKTVAFEEAFSTSGYILPAVAMLRSGLKLAHLESFRSRNPDDKVGFVMANDNETQIVWLERDKVAAAAMAEEDFKKYSTNALRSMRILHTTPYVPYHVITYRANLDPKYVEQMKEILLSAHKTADGKKLLEKFEATLKFDEIPEELLLEVSDLSPFIFDLQLSQ
ncbi:MAG: phosphate/phosphite/phosphonate ABC transporter substrate-binding protein [Sneathiella sp.]